MEEQDSDGYDLSSVLYIGFPIPYYVKACQIVHSNVVYTLMMVFRRYIESQ
jgi:hypothetical protein